MNLSLFAFPFLVSFVLSFLILCFLVFLSKIKKNKSNSLRHPQGREIFRLGGLAIIVSFSITLFFDQNLFISKPILAIIISSFAILIFGLVDDFREINWKNQLFFQIAVAMFIFIMGIRVEYITNPMGGVINLGLGDFIMPSLFFVIFWTVMFMNSMNWIDGIDGLSGGITIIGAITIFFLSLKPEVNQPPVGLIAATLIGAILAFLILNFNPSKIIAGTSGSMFFGFILSVMAIFAGTKIATALLVMTVPIVDAFWVIFERIMNGQSVFEPDRRHLHHKLMDLGWSQRKICFFFYGITALMAFIALNTRIIGKMVTISLSVLMLFVILYFVNKKVYAKSLSVKKL